MAGGLLRFALYCVGEAVGFYAFEDEVSLAQAEVVVGSPELVLFIFVPLLISGIGVLALVVYMTIARVWMARRAKGRTAMRLKDKAICALVFVVGFLGSWTLYKATGVFLFGHDPSFLLII